MEWIDTHAHLSDKRLANRIDAVLAAAAAAGVVRTLAVGIDLESSRQAVALAAAYPDCLAAAVGLHPNSVPEAWADDFAAIADLAERPEVVAVGETGLDRHWDTVPFARQTDSLRRHLELARKLDKAIVLHGREAEADVADELRRFGGPVRGVMHSYTGDAATAAACLDLGLHVSFAGMLTYPKADVVRDVAATIPLDRLLVETDAPYLAPQPVRGKPNEPAFVVHTGVVLAAAKGVAVAEMAAATTRNARALFRFA